MVTKEIRGGYMRQKRLIESCPKTQRRSLQNDERINSIGYNTYKYIYASNNGSLEYINQTLTDLKGEIDGKQE